MKVVHVVSTYPPYRGGQGNVAWEIAGRTAARGDEVVVVTARPRIVNHELRMKGDNQFHDSSFIIHHSSPRLRFGNAAWCPSIRRTLEDLQSDLVHLHWPFIGGIAPVIAWRIRSERSENHSLIRTNRRIAVSQPLATLPDAHSHFRAKMRMKPEPRRLVVQYHMDLIGSGWRGAVFAAYQQRALPHVLAAADRVVVSSLDYARHGALAPYIGELGERLVEIPIGVDLSRFTSRFLPPKPPLPEERGETKKIFSPSHRDGFPPARGGARGGGSGEREGEGFRALFVGGLDRAHAFKGLPVLLEAMARLTDGHRSLRMVTDHGCRYPLRVVGEGDLRPAYETQARALGISDRVEFFGSVPDDALPDIYRSADVLILPSTSRSEAFGVVLLEAMASGLPVIASDLPGVRTVVIDGETGFLVPPGDVQALADRLSLLAQDPNRARTMGAAARRRVGEQYGWDRVMEQWDAVYESNGK